MVIKMASPNIELVVFDLYETLVDHHREGPSPFFQLFDDLFAVPVKVSHGGIDLR